MSKSSKTFPVGRDARTGQFISARVASRRSATTTIVERVPKSGYGEVPRELRSVVIRSDRKK